MNGYNSKNKRFGIIAAIIFCGIVTGILLSPVKDTMAQTLQTVECPYTTHWDKIVFKVPFSIPSVFNGISSQPALVPDRIYDIKIASGTSDVVTDLNQEVYQFLVNHGYNLSISQGAKSISLQPDNIKIVSVEYAVQCAPLDFSPPTTNNNQNP